MSNIILQPLASTLAQKHFERTIKSCVDIDMFAEFISGEQLKVLKEFYPSGKMQIWGIKGGANDVNIRKWDRIKKDDIVLFSGHGKIFAYAKITYKFESNELAEVLWQVDENGQKWKLIYFIKNLKPLNVPYAEFNEIVGYAPSNVIQGFNVLCTQKSTTIIKGLRL